MSPLKQYVVLLLRHHAAVLSGDDCEEEKVCEEMDGPWHVLSAEDQVKARLISSQLNQLTAGLKDA